MSHVDEGTLHAYLDGELPSADRATLEAHVAECGACRAALADERALRDRASAVLGRARPLERPTPPFERIRRTPARRPWQVRTAFAWAASIVLALGVGYLLRSPTAEVAASRQQQPAAVEPTAVATNQTRAAPPAEQKATPLPQERTKRRAPAPADEQSRTSDKTTPPVDVVAAAAPTAELRNAAPAPVAAGRVNDSLQPERHQASRLEGVVVRGAAAAAPARSERDMVSDGATVQPSNPKTWPLIDRRLATSVLGEEPVAVPGLAVRSFRRGPGNDGTIVVEQTLDSATVIQIFQRPARTSVNDSAERGRADHFGRFVGGLRVEIAGPVSTDSLNRLLDQVKPLR